MLQRKRTLFCTAIACGLALLVSAQPGLAGEVRVLVPDDGATFFTERVFLVLEVAPATPLLLETKGRPVPLVAVPGRNPERSVLHAWISLPEGKSALRLLDAEDEGELARLTLTRLPTRAAIDGDVAETSYVFHTPDREAACTTCHALPQEMVVIPENPTAPAERICDSCHRNLEEQAYLHGPAAVYACFTCHDPASRPSRFALREAQPESCRGCHADVMAQVMGGKRFAHGPVAVGQCTVCHGPHGGDTPTLLRSSLPDLCLRCHGQSLPAPVSRGLHGKLPCTACHGPHGGTTRVLTAEAGNSFCTHCHKDIDPEAPGHPIMGHPVREEESPVNASRPMGCASCHPPHGQRDISRLDFAGNAALQRRFCTGCHT